MLKVLSIVLNDEPAGTRTQDSRLKSTDTSEINQHPKLQNACPIEDKRFHI